jgi:hypothetical protein
MGELEFGLFHDGVSATLRQRAVAQKTKTRGAG